MQVGRLEIIAYSGNDKSEFTNNGGDPEEEERFLPSYADGLGVEPIRLSIRRIGFRPLTISLTSYTVKELEAMRGIIVGAFDVAVERSAVLDAEAHRQSMEGNDSIPRTWRLDPQVMERPQVLTRTALPVTVVLEQPDNPTTD